MNILTKQIISSLLGIITLFFLIWILWGKLFPEDKDVKPILKESKQEIKEVSKVLNEAIKVNKGVSNESITPIKPIKSIPVIKLHQYKQPSNRDIRSSDKISKGSKNNNIPEYPSNQEIEQFSRWIETRSSTIKSESEKIKRSSSQSLIECYTEDGSQLTTGCTTNNIEVSK